MQLNAKALILLLFVASVGARAQSNSFDFGLVPVSSNAKHSMRLQFSQQGDSVHVWGSNLLSLPRKFKKIKFINPKAKLKIAEVRAQAAKSLNATYAVQQDTALGFKTKLLGEPYYKHLQDKFLKGHSNSTAFANQNIHLGAIPVISTWPLNFAAKVPKGGTIAVHYLPSLSLKSLPVYDPNRCGEVPLEFLNLRRSQGYGFDKITYKPYNANKRVTITKAFDLYFEAKSTQPQEDQIEAITDYLEQNQLEILNAVMVGGSSVEGDAEQNKILQRERARVVSQALSRYNKSAIRKDTIMLSDNWPKFREQIKTSPFAWLDSLSNEQIQFEINHNKKILEGLESILKTQRKASLNLRMAKILTADDQFSTLQKSMNDWIKSMVSPSRSDKEAEQKILGGMAYLLERYFNHELKQEEVESLLEGEFMEYKYSYLGIHIIKQFSENRFGPEGKWKATWDSLNLEPWFFRAQKSLLRLSATAPKNVSPKYLKMLVDFQTFMYKLIGLEVLSADILCTMPYPEKPEYLGLILTHYAFLYEVGNAPCGAGRIWMTVKEANKSRGTDLDSAKRSLQKYYVRGADGQEINGNQNEEEGTPFQLIVGGSNLPRTGFQPRNHIPPTYDQSIKEPYYYLLKQVFVKGNKSILKYFEGDPSLNAFNLYHLLTLYSMPNWEPERNYFYDKEVRLEEMDKLINLLKKTSVICVPVSNSLYLTYHMNALRYLELYFEPGNASHREIAYNSLRFISEYYKKRINQLEPDEPALVAMYLNRFNWFPGPHEGAWFGFDLMNIVAQKRKLTETEMKLWANYMKIYDPELKRPLPKQNPKEVVQSAMASVY